MNLFVINLFLAALFHFIVLKSRTVGQTLPPWKRLPNVEILTTSYLAPNSSSASTSLSQIQPVIESAMEALRRNYHDIFNVSHVYIVQDGVDGCGLLKDEVANMLSQYVLQRSQAPQMTAIISAACQEAVVVNELAREWNYLMITSTAAEQSTANRQISPTWITTTISSMPSYVNLYLTLFHRFSWSNIFILLQTDTSPLFSALYSSLYGVLYASPRYSVTGDRFSLLDGKEKLVDVLEKLRNVSRVCVFLGNAAPLRNLLAEAINMTNSDYVYIGLEVFHDPTVWGSYTWNYHDSNDKIARNAYRSLLKLGTTSTDAKKLDTFSGNNSNNSTHPTKANPYLTALYDAYMMFGMILNETLSRDGVGNLLNGRAFAKRFLNRTFKTELEDVYIDGTGLRRLDLTVSDLNVSSGKFNVVALQRGEGWVWQETGQIDWGNGRSEAPPNEPFCGLLNDASRCLATRRDPAIEASVVLVLGAAFCCAIGFFVRKSQWFRVRIGLDDSHTWWIVNRSAIAFPSSA